MGKEPIMPLDFSTLTAEDATADEAKITRTRTSKVADTPITGWLKETHEKGTYKKLTAANEDQAKEILKAVKLAAKHLGIGYKAKTEGNVVIFGGKDKKEYTLTEEGKAKRAEALRKANAARREAKAAAEAAAKGDTVDAAGRDDAGPLTPEDVAAIVNDSDDASERVGEHAGTETGETPAEAVSDAPTANDAAPAATGNGRRRRSHA